MKTYNGKVENSLYYCAKGICQSCHYRSESDCRGSLIKDAAKEEANDQRLIESQFETIQEQKAEIERLKKANESFSCLGQLYSEIKTEAIKEFAERLKNSTLPVTFGGMCKYDVITKEDIDNLVKEMERKEDA